MHNLAFAIRKIIVHCGLWKDEMMEIWSYFLFMEVLDIPKTNNKVKIYLKR